MLRMLMLAAGAAAVLAQAAQSPETQFRSGIEVVTIDVSVLDGNRRPVRGLTMADFEVLEDGKPRPIVAFDAIEIPSRSPLTGWRRDVAPDVRTNAEAADRRLLVILIDDALLPFETATIKSAKSIARDIVERMSPVDEAAVVFSGSGKSAQSFTSDRQALFAAIDRLRGGFNTFDKTKADMDFHWKNASRATVANTLKLLSRAPQRRKAVFWIAVGNPTMMRMAEPFQMGGSSTAPDLQEIPAAMTDLLTHAQAGSVNVYGIDPSGLDGLRFYLQRAPMLSTGPNGRIVRSPAAAEADAGVHRATLEDFSLATGGFAVTNTNEFTPGIDRIFEEQSTYYVLGFTSGGIGKTRSRIKVRVKRKDMEVRTRNVLLDRAARPVAPDASPRVEAAMSGLMPANGLRMDAAVYVLPPSAGRGSSLLAVTRVTQTADGPAVQPTEVLTKVFTPDGYERASARQTARVEMATDASGDAVYQVLSQVDVKRGRYSVRIAASNPALSKMGGVYADAEMPDWNAVPFGLSSVILSVEPDVKTEPKDAAGLPVTPTTRRSFIQADSVRAFVRVHIGAGSAVRDVPLTIEITDQNGRRAKWMPGTVQAREFRSGRSADHVFAIPVRDLAPGEYLLTVTARPRFTRQVRFSVQ